MASVLSILFQLVSFGACLFLIFGLIYLMVREVLDAPRHRDWDLKWPPIDDDEFIRRCHPGVNREIALKARRIISEQLGVPYQQIYPEQSFHDDLDCC